MWNLQDLREGIDRLYRTRRKLESLSEEQYAHGTWWCGTVGCTLGWASQACPEVFTLLPTADKTESIPTYNRNGVILSGYIAFHVSKGIERYLFYTHISRYAKNIGRHDGQLSTAIKRVYLVEQWFRRRLAVMEVELNEDGSHRRAKDVPCGKERECLLREVVYV